MRQFQFRILFSIVFINLFIVFSANTMNLNSNEFKLVSEVSLDNITSKDLKLNIESGNVEIKTWNKATANVQFYFNETGQKKYKSDAFVSEDGLFVSVVKKSLLNFIPDSAEILVKITLPKSFSISSDIHGGDIQISDLSGKIDAQTHGGTIELKKIKGTMDLNSSGGSIKLTETTGPLSLKSSGGSIELSEIEGNMDLKLSGGLFTGKKLKGDFKLVSSGGIVDCETSDGKVVIEASGGKIFCNYSGANKGISLKSHGGLIELKLPEKINGTIDMRASGGKINTGSFTLNDAQYEEERIQGNLNNGGPDILCYSSGGNITLIKK